MVAVLCLGRTVSASLCSCSCEVDYNKSSNEVIILLYSEPDDAGINSMIKG